MCLLLAGRGLVWAQESDPAQTPPQSSGQSQEKELPNAPEVSQKKDESANPAESVEHKTKRELLRARDWESGWITGEYVGRNRPLVSPTRVEREVIYLRETLTTPEAYIKRMFAAGIDQARGVPYQWDDGWTGYAERFRVAGGAIYYGEYVSSAGAMRSWDTKSATTAASAMDCGRGRGMRLSGT